MMPYESYQLYQIERPKTEIEIRCADERAGRQGRGTGDGIYR